MKNKSRFKRNEHSPLYVKSKDERWIVSWISEDVYGFRLRIRKIKESIASRKIFLVMKKSLQ